MKGYFNKCVWRLLKSFPFSASNKCEVQTTAEAFYGAPAPLGSVDTFATREHCTTMLSSVYFCWPLFKLGWLMPGLPETNCYSYLTL